MRSLEQLPLAIEADGYYCCPLCVAEGKTGKLAKVTQKGPASYCTKHQQHFVLPTEKLIAIREIVNAQSDVSRRLEAALNALVTL